MEPTRRRVLTLGATGAALLAVGGGLSWVALGYRVADGDVPIALSTKELAVVRAVVETLLPGGEGIPSGLSLGVHQRIDEELWSAPEAVRSDLKAALHLLEHAPPLQGFAGRFTRLHPADRERVFVGWLRSERAVLAQAANGLKQMCQLFAYTSPQTWAAIGYDGPWVERPAPPPSSVAYAALLAERRRR